MRHLWIGMMALMGLALHGGCDGRVEVGGGGPTDVASSSSAGASGTGVSRHVEVEEACKAVCKGAQHCLTDEAAADCADSCASAPAACTLEQIDFLACVLDRDAACRGGACSGPLLAYENCLGSNTGGSCDNGTFVDFNGQTVFTACDGPGPCECYFNGTAMGSCDPTSSCARPPTHCCRRLVFILGLYGRF
jgi:hypothetical protein